MASDTTQSGVGNATATTTAHVLQTVELLELILTSLPMRDILVSEMVCGQWHSVIQRSRKIQQTLFKLTLGIPVGPSLTAKQVGSCPTYCQELAFNTILCGPSTNHDEEICNSPGRVAVAHTFGVPDVDHFEVGISESDAPQGYIDMFVTQPPCTTALLSVTGHDRTKTIRCVARDVSGLKYRHLLELAQKMAFDSKPVKDGGKRISAFICITMPVTLAVETHTREQWAYSGREFQKACSGRAKEIRLRLLVLMKEILEMRRQAEACEADMSMPGKSVPDLDLDAEYATLQRKYRRTIWKSDFMG